MSDREFKFTMGRIEALPSAAPGKRDTYLDIVTPGLVVRVTDKGAKSFCLVRKVEGRMGRLTLGKFPAMSVDEARRKAQEENVAIARGENPIAKRKRLRDDSTLEDLFNWYVTQGTQLKDKTLDHYRHTFKLYLTPLAKRKATQVTKADIRTLHAKVSMSAPYAANRMLALVRATYNTAIKADMFTGSNPATGIQANKETSRETRLLPGQIEGFFKALDAYPDHDIRDFFTLTLLTGQRKGSMLAMRWADIHLDDRLWIIPDTKNNRPHTVPLLDAELEILERRKASTKSPWVFPSHGESGHLVEPKKAWATIIKAAGIPKGGLRIHDLRRSLGSFMVDAGASLPTIGKTLGHMNQSTTAIYARLALDPVREAKAKAHAAIEASRNSAPGKVVNLNPSRKKAGDESGLG